jgi:hypothetical protein
MRIITVFNSRSLTGAAQEFKPQHVQALQKQLEKWAPGVSFECITDKQIPGVTCIPYTKGWPGWWAKMALFDPALPGDFLFMDLDTVIVGPLDDILAVNKLTLLRDFYRDGKKLKEGLGGGLIYLPDEVRVPVWNFWITNPALNSRLYSRGDQFLLERFWLNTAARWQDEVPGQVVSYKVHCQNGVPPDARVVCFHGKPRPWETGQFLHLYR